MITTADPLSIVRTVGATAFDFQDWTAHDEKAHRIIQEHLSDALLLKTESCNSAMALWKELKKLLDAPNVSSAFYIFQQLFHATWDRSTGTVLEHIVSLQTSEACLAAMEFTIDAKVMAFILLNSLPKTPEWELFKGMLINSTEDSKITFDTVETQIIAGDACLHSFGHSKSAMKASRPSQSSTHLPNSSAWCEHHLSATHNSADCNTYKKWVIELRKGGSKKPDKERQRANPAKGVLSILDILDSTNVVDENVSESLTKCIHAYSLSEQSDSGRNTLIIDSEAHGSSLILVLNLPSTKSSTTGNPWKQHQSACYWNWNCPTYITNLWNNL